MGPSRALIASALALAAALLAVPGTAQSGDVVEIRLVADNGFSFTPADVTIRPGGTVRWIYDDDSGAPHTVTSIKDRSSKEPDGTFNEELEEDGDLFEYTFDSPGSFDYYCAFHPNTMVGTVTVEVGGSSTPGFGVAFLLVGLIGSIAILRRRA